MCLWVLFFVFNSLEKYLCRQLDFCLFPKTIRFSSKKLFGWEVKHLQPNKRSPDSFIHNSQGYPVPDDWESTPRFLTVMVMIFSEIQRYNFWITTCRFTFPLIFHAGGVILQSTGSWKKSLVSLWSDRLRHHWSVAVKLFKPNVQRCSFSTFK